MQGYQYSAMHRKQCIIYINQMFIGLQGPNFGHLRKFPGTYIMRLGYIYIYIYMPKLQFWGRNGQILGISEFSQHQHYVVFPEEDHKFSVYSEKYENL